MPTRPFARRCLQENKGLAVRARLQDRSMHQGFTLIELAVVIAIVAVTTAMVLPRVWDWQRQARIGNLNYVRGAVHSASTLVHAAVIARDGRPDGAPCPGGGGTATNASIGRGTVCTDHGLVRTLHGHPASVAPGDSLPGILGAAGVGTVFRASAEQLRAQGFDVSVAGPRTTIARADAPRPADCSFTYSEPLVARTAASISMSVVTGC
jgi:MSHA pilin protein MshA